MKIIVNCDENNGIGKNGNLLCHIPTDLKRFKEMTTGNVIVMGKNTLFSFKDRKPLPNRINVVLTHDTKLKENYKDYDNIHFIYNIDELSSITKLYNDKEIFIIGGETIYRQFIDKCDTILLTKVYHNFSADTFFPKIDSYNYHKFSESEIMTYDFENEGKYIELQFQYIEYRKME